ncbi:SH3 domain-containing protein [Ekhidna sp. To15]|uniref:SH3 domain-containing protein n=1 Tax=Ekhidna sp. To15 TaxID=3395267 RepID=UPI003F525961
MRTTFSILLICIAGLTQAQWLGIINDPDGYTNVREQPTTNSKILGKFYDNEVFQIWDLDYDTIPNWRKVYKWNPESREALVGWMHKSRIKDLDFLPEIQGFELSQNGSVLTLNKNGIFFQLEFEQFDSTKHEIIRDERGYITAIDGKYPQGTDGYMPREGVKSAVLKINDKTYKFPKDAYRDLFEFRKNTARFFYKKDGTYMIRFYNSDGAGHYMLVWKFQNGEYLGRYLGSI